MGLFDGIKKRKELVSQRKHLARANKLKSYRAERLKQEGRVKVINLEKKEKARILKAKAEVREANTPRFLRNVQKRNVQKNFKKKPAGNFKKNLKKMNDKPANNLFSNVGGYNPIFHSTGGNNPNRVTKKKGEGGKGIFY